MSRDRTILAVFAHPDDEVFAAGGTLARYAAAGVATVLVTCTRGENGEISDPALATAETIGDVRTAELAEAVDALGIGQSLFLGFRDSGMAGQPTNDDPASFHAADASDAVGRLVRLIRQHRPQVVLTHNEHGDYGHPDHVRANRFVTEAFRQAGDPSAYPDAGAPFSPRKLYYGAFPRQSMQRLAEALHEAGIESPFQNRDLRDTEGRPVELGTPDDMVTTEVDVTSVLDRKRRAFFAHRTQFGEGHFLRTMPDELYRRLWTHEYFRLIEGPGGAANGRRETDLFAGL